MHDSSSADKKPAAMSFGMCKASAQGHALCQVFAAKQSAMAPSHLQKSYNAPEQHMPTASAATHVYHQAAEGIQ